MKPAIDVRHINPFLQSSISIMESVTQIKLAVGRPEVTDFNLRNTSYAIQVGVVGEMKGQAILVMSEDNAKEIASKMMYGMPIAEIDEMAASALNELGNMIMGNAATVFSTQGILIDIPHRLLCMAQILSLEAILMVLRFHFCIMVNHILIYTFVYTMTNR